MDNQNLYEELFSEQTSENNKNKQGLHRSANNIVFAGVCAGIASYLNKDVKYIRFATLLLLILGWWIIIFYLVLAFLLPLEKNPIGLTTEEYFKIDQEKYKAVFGGLLVLAGIHFSLVELGLRYSDNLFLLSNGFTYPLLAIFFSIFLFLEKNNFYYYKEPRKSFRLSKKRKIFLGVCSGLSKYLSIDLILVRIFFLIFSLLTLGLFTLFYFLIYFFSKYELEVV